jgi:hypothetical protein
LSQKCLSPVSYEIKISTRSYWGIPDIKLPLGLNTIYDIAIAILAVILGFLYTFSSIKEALALAKLEE